VNQEDVWVVEKAKIKLKGDQDKNGVDRSENKELREWRMAVVDPFFTQAQARGGRNEDRAWDVIV
jgi:hypothetical protein